MKPLKIGPAVINWRHLASFALVVVAIFSKQIHDAILAGTPISWGWLAASGVGGAIWAAFEDSILPDIIGGGGGTATVGKPLVFDKGLSKPPPPASMRDAWLRWAPLRMACGMLLAASVLTPLLSGCAQLKQDIAVVAPIFDKIAAIVVAGLRAGETPQQIEDDVARALAGQTGVDIVTVVNEVITFLIDTGEIKGNLLEPGHALQAHAQATLAARKAAAAR